MRDEPPLEDEFDPDSPEQIAAMLMMLEYLLPQARAVSPVTAFYLGLVRHELTVAQALREEVIARFPSLQ
jgi:hypothetical protein